MKYRDVRQAPGDDWTAVEFDDRDWKEGPGILGYGDNNLGTRLEFGDNPDHKPITVWLRKSFTLRRRPT